MIQANQEDFFRLLMEGAPSGGQGGQGGSGGRGGNQGGSNLLFLLFYLLGRVIHLSPEEKAALDRV
jgi:hypothetical protein